MTRTNREVAKRLCNQIWLYLKLGRPADAVDEVEACLAVQRAEMELELEEREWRNKIGDGGDNS